MARRLNKNNLILFLFFTCLLLLLALLICVIALLSGGRGEALPAEAEPGTEMVEARLLMEHAAAYDVSTEYLQLLLPGYLIYRDGTEYVFSPLDEHLEQHDYDWSALRYDFGRIHYADGRDVTYGVDVSTYQGEIDWQAVAEDGIDFAMVRLGYRGYSKGGLQIDEYALKNLDGAAAAGLEVGAYFFSQAISEAEAEEEARLALELLDGRELAYPVVFDMEEITEDAARTDALSIKERTDITLAFCRVIEEAGYQPMVYGNIKWLAGRIDLTRLHQYPLWLAQYYERPLFPYLFHMWQYTDSGEVAGIETTVDLNICFKPFGE
ncbi:MAG: glycoside hydrolase family 25 protein [Firmicutes bacterium]|nr:glycoside hydrolase family 25 protein [Bacillota bacterium]